MDAGIQARLSPAEGRRFGVTIGIAFLVVSLLLWWRGHDLAGAMTATLAVFFTAGGLLVPGRMGPIYRGWMRFGLAISKVTTPILLGIIFFLVITPVGLIARAFGHRPLHPPASDSLWRPRPRGERKSDLKRQF